MPTSTQIVESRLTQCDPLIALNEMCASGEIVFRRPLTTPEAKVYFGASSHETARFTRMPNNGVAGVKPGSGWTGKVALHKTHEGAGTNRKPIEQYFRAYATARDGFFDWFARVLIPGYPEAVAGAAQGDVERYVRGLHQGWGRGAHYFTGDPGEYTAGIWREIRYLDGLPIDWATLTTPRRVPGGAS
jgi:hypothetical protein